MRERRSGTIVNISSTAGVYPRPGASMYSASKFALESISEALNRELMAFDLRVLIVEPGALRTNFLQAGAYTNQELNPAYRNTPLSATLDALKTQNGTQRGDPKKAARVMYEAIVGEARGAKADKGVLRLLLGPDAIERMNARLNSMTSDLAAIDCTP
ncbi:NAD(P)-binding protein [Zopfia rhizophila CBS 207.26]|uniref:NAD(P)-binding protein n=1 Tax=Zopfia rhizophila CBS 207.26 TaxID=1314779 RepID=A0A6A6ELG6_9PEZI|nr:NAD(P)-binding protein [Zopfia rhizophila CBS 207.26]